MWLLGEGRINSKSCMWARVDEGAGALPEVALLEYLTVQAQLTALEQVLHRKTRLQQAAMESEK